jgi:hypothetical protein
MRNLFLFFTCCLTFIVFAPQANAAPKIVNDHVPQAKAIGEGVLKFFFKDIYTARLYASNGEWTNDAPYALELTYDLGLKGDKIAERSIVEMRKIGYEDEEQLGRWLAEMTRIFPDVEDGTILTGIYTAEQRTLFYENNTLIGEIEDPEFGKAFFNIWLSQDTSEPELRQALLGIGLER